MTGYRETRQAGVQVGRAKVGVKSAILNMFDILLIQNDKLGNYN